MTRKKYSSAGLLIGCLCVVLCFIWHISVGAKSLTFLTVVDAFWHFNSSNFDHIIVRSMRLPRALIAITVGAALAVAGAIMQGVTRNPLAEPGLLGLLSGASFAAVISVSFFGLETVALLPVIAAMGALLSAVVVWLVASRAVGGATPLTLTLAGAAVSGLMAAIVSILNLLDQQTFEVLRGWLVGSLTNRGLSDLKVTLPWIGLGLVGALLLAPSITSLAMGDEQAAGLGINVTRRKWQLLACVVILTAASVTLAGPLGFVGLVIPHMVRMFLGADYRWVVPYAAIFGAAYLLGVDTLARLIVRPQEIATGLITALLGGPLFIYLVRIRLR
jgi:iron complex transport system permease protein